VKTRSIISIIFLLLFAICLTAPTFADDAKTFAGGQLVFKFTLNTPMSEKVNTYIKAVHFSMRSGPQDWMYVGAKVGVPAFYAGGVNGWRDTDCGFIGTTIDVPLNRLLWSTEADAVLFEQKVHDFYIYTGVDYNFGWCGHPMWFGPQFEGIMTDKFVGQTGVRLGFEFVELGFYGGDLGWNVRGTITIPLENFLQK
jgi:hypothetical protein